MNDVSNASGNAGLPIIVPISNKTGAVITELCRKHGLLSATCQAWKTKFEYLEVSDAKLLRGLNDENGRLKRLRADTMLDNGGLKDLLSKNGQLAAKRQAVAHLQIMSGMSDRQACAVVRADRTSVRYRSCKEDDGDQRSRLRELAQQRRRFDRSEVLESLTEGFLTCWTLFLSRVDLLICS